MAHPHSEHRAHHVARKRAHHLMKDGGHAKHPHADEAADRKLFKKMIAEHEHKVHGHAKGGRLHKFARGGAAKKGAAQVNIAIVTPHGKASDQPMGATPGGPPALPPRPIGPALGGSPPPALPPGLAGPPGPMMPPRPPMKRGGRVKMDAGAKSGEGRLEKIKAYGKNARKA